MKELEVLSNFANSGCMHSCSAVHFFADKNIALHYQEMARSNKCPSRHRFPSVVDGGLLVGDLGKL